MPDAYQRKVENKETSLLVAISMIENSGDIK